MSLSWPDPISVERSEIEERLWPLIRSEERWIGRGARGWWSWAFRAASGPLTLLVDDFLHRAQGPAEGRVDSGVRAQPPAPRSGLGIAGCSTSSARFRARRRKCSPPHEAHHQATARWPGGRRVQQARCGLSPILAG